MRLHRGIAVPAAAADQVVCDIRREGLVPGRGQWKLLFHYLKPHLDEIWRLPIVTQSDTRPEGDTPPDWVCACADELGALYYACRHNLAAERDTPLLITFDADITDIIVDGRDSLYTLFQMGDPDRARPIATVLFGDAIHRYLDRAWSTEGRNEAVAVCDLAIQDDAVIAAHARNTAVIGGRNRTRFRSAFLVRMPISAKRIIEVRRINAGTCIPEPEITLDMVRTLQ